MTPAPGARTANEPDEATAAANVQSLFNTIAPTYDRLNHLLSFGLDRHWWNRTARKFSDILARPEARVLDLCCGTGDQTAALLALRPRGGPSVPHHGTGGNPGTVPGAPSSPTVSSSVRVGSAGAPYIESVMWASTALQGTPVQPIIGLDFSSEMLHRARTKFPTPNVRWVEADAMHLPYADNTFDLVTAAFGFRNLSNYAAALTEIHRVLRPHGRLGILECNHPDGVSGAFYKLYLHFGLPLIGGLLSGERAAYAYLPASIARFPRPPAMKQLLTDAGFANPTWDGYFMKAAGLYVASRS